MTDDDRRSRTAETTEKALHGLIEVGRLWAAHGLNVGRAALDTSAQTLRVTSSLLGELGDALDPNAPAPAPEEPVEPA